MWKVRSLCLRFSCLHAGSHLQAQLCVCGGPAHPQEIKAQDWALHVLEGLADADRPLTVALVPGLPETRLQLQMQVT